MKNNTHLSAEGKPLDTKSLTGLSKLSAYCRGYQATIILAMALSIIATVCTLIGPGQLSKITDTILQTIQGAIDLKSIFAIGGILVGIYVLSLLCGFFQEFIMVTITQKIIKGLRCDISHKSTVCL